MRARVGCARAGEEIAAGDVEAGRSTVHCFLSITVERNTGLSCMTLKSTGPEVTVAAPRNEHLPMICEVLGGEEISPQTVLTVTSVTAVFWLCLLPVVCLHSCVWAYHLVCVFRVG